VKYRIRFRDCYGDAVFDLKKMNDGKREWLPPRVAYAPGASGDKKNVVDTVILQGGQDVEWVWTHTATGSFVSGYHIHDWDDKET
jgi:hypothetical protein